MKVKNVLIQDALEYEHDMAYSPSRNLFFTLDNTNSAPKGPRKIYKSLKTTINYESDDDTIYNPISDKTSKITRDQFPIKFTLRATPYSDVKIPWRVQNEEFYYTYTINKSTFKIKGITYPAHSTNRTANLPKVIVDRQQIKGSFKPIFHMQNLKPSAEGLEGMVNIAINKLVASINYPPLCNDILLVNTTTWKEKTKVLYYGRWTRPQTLINLR